MSERVPVTIRSSVFFGESVSKPMILRRVYPVPKSEYTALAQSVADRWSPTCVPTATDLEEGRKRKKVAPPSQQEEKRRWAQWSSC